ncbi:MAG TPA: SPFH domain-containing protein [Leptospiraceae bacterium]|nr:SPFH domain-containing protein [Leptospiraceae bacterium]HMW06973.1 SPFH domain-containing protein [Leptospiraceae bacterium]HMX32642.1 SPFH domain-containing protein [Leptospiraceae bacterium]HMY30379.1 SPFH domain-containing protein [Leptospiraceae bacterium]HMZ65893.1 SPFH domain-containing protein [Leptospiraceae bacterium]
MTFVLARLLVVLAILFILAYFLMVVIVPENSVFIQERLGRYTRTLNPGVYFQVPIIEKIAFRFTQKEQIRIIKELVCTAANGSKVYIDAIFIFQIEDPVKAAYTTENYIESVLIETENSIITEIQNYLPEEIIPKKYGINQSIVKNTGEICKNFGLKIIRFEIQQMKRDAKIT